MRVTHLVRAIVKSPAKGGSGQLAGPAKGAEIAERLAAVKHKVLVMSGKGGVGKSTVSATLARALALHRKVSILDIDICGPSIPRLMGAEGQQVFQGPKGWKTIPINQNLSVMSIGFLLANDQNTAVVWRGPRKHGMIRQFLKDVDWGELDYLVIDTPPGTSDEHISIAESLQAVSAVDGAILVTTPQEVSLMDVRKEVAFCKTTKLPIMGVVENMSSFVCPCCNEQSVIFPPTTGGAESMCEQMQLQLMAKVPLDPRMALCSDNGEDFLETHAASPAAVCYNNLARLVMEMCEK